MVDEMAIEKIVVDEMASWQSDKVPSKIATKRF
jgi:hypothetical protein